MTGTSRSPSAGADGDGDLLEVACRDLVELVTEYFEGTLTEELARAVRDHLSLCGPCVEYLRQVRRTTEALGDLPLPTLPPARRTELLEVFARIHGDRAAGRGGGDDAPGRPGTPLPGSAGRGSG